MSSRGDECRISRIRGDVPEESDLHNRQRSERHVVWMDQSGKYWARPNGPGRSLAGGNGGYRELWQTSYDRQGVRAEVNAMYVPLGGELGGIGVQ